jgi:uncharacterized protein
MSDKSSATDVVLLHPVPDDRLRSWIDRATAAAGAMPGFESLRLSVAGDGLAPAVVAAFDTAEHLHTWLDSGAYAEAFSDTNSQGVLRKSSDLLIVEGARLPPGTAVFSHDVIPQQTSEFIDTEQRLATAIAQYPGFSSLILLAPAPGKRQWTSILSFRTDEQLSAWLASDERARGLAQLRSHLTKDFDTLSVDAPFGSILRIDHGRPRVTPPWRTAMLVLLVLYPTVMTLSRFYVPVLTRLGAHPWLSTWLNQVVCVAAMSYALMPLATRLFARWLDPVDGAPVRVSVLGTVAVVATYAATLSVFASVRWLQFWDYS